MVHQHFMLVPVFTVTENVMLGVEPVRNGVFLDRPQVAAHIRDISDQYNLALDPDALVKDLSVGVQQRVEIVKTLYRNAEILIFDEPTAVLTPQEVEEFFKIVRSLVARGVSVIFITHKLKEVLAIADRITVLRNGRVAGTAIPGKTTPGELARLMVGREVILVSRQGPGQARRARPCRSATSARWMTATRLKVDGVSFTVHAGEVLGVAGVQGNGQTELVEALTGLRPVAGGSVTIERARRAARPALGRSRRWAWPTCPRTVSATAWSSPIRCSANMVLNTYYLPPFAIRHRAAREPAILAAASGARGQVRRPHAEHSDAHLHAVRRQPAEGDRGAGSSAAPSSC